MFKKLIGIIKSGNTAPVTHLKSLKLQGDNENGIFVVKEFYKPYNVLNEDDIYICGFDFDDMDNSAVELTDQNLIAMAEYYYFEALDDEQLKEHVDRTYLARNQLAL